MSVQNLVDLLQSLSIILLAVVACNLRRRAFDAPVRVRDSFTLRPCVYADLDTGRRFLAGTISRTSFDGSNVLRADDCGIAYWLDELPVQTATTSSFRFPSSEDMNENQ